MLQTEAYLYDRKLRWQTFIVQATDHSTSWPCQPGGSLRIPVLGYNVGQPPTSLIVRSTNSQLDQMGANAIIYGTDFNNCRTKKYNFKKIYTFVQLVFSLE